MKWLGSKEEALRTELEFQEGLQWLPILQSERWIWSLRKVGCNAKGQGKGKVSFVEPQSQGRC